MNILCHTKCSQSSKDLYDCKNPIDTFLSLIWTITIWMSLIMLLNIVWISSQNVIYILLFLWVSGLSFVEDNSLLLSRFPVINISHLLSGPEARPTNNISIKFQIQSNFIMFLFIIYSANRNEILHTSRQKHCRDMCKILLWLFEYILNQCNANFARISNWIKIPLVGWAPGAHCIKNSFTLIQVWWQVYFTLIQNLIKWNWQNISQFMTNVPSWLLQKFIINE